MLIGRHRVLPKRLLSLLVPFLTLLETITVSVHQEGTGAHFNFLTSDAI